MPKPNPDTTNTNASSRLTYDKGLGNNHFPPEQIQYIFDIHGNIAGTYCPSFNALENDVLDLNKPETISQYKIELERQFSVLHAALIWLKYTSTSCLLKAAVSCDQLMLLLLTNNDLRKGIIISNSLIDIYNEIERRTRNPYQFNIVFDNKDMFKPLPQKILQEYPLNRYAFWKQTAQRKLTNTKKPEKNEGLIPLLEKEDKAVDGKEMEKALEIADANVRIRKELDTIPPGDTPLVNEYKANLTKLTLQDVYKQTGVSLKNRADWKFSDLVEVIYYASAITLVLDKNGEPFDTNGIYGLFRYGMILPSKKFKTVKFFPPPGKYISLGPLAGQQFSFDGGIVKKLPVQYSGILSFQEVDVTGQWEPDYQVNANEILGRNHVYIGSLVVDSAFSPQEITLSSLIGTLPVIVEETIPYFYKAVTKKIQSWFENYEDFLKEIAVEVLKNILIETLKDLAKWYIIKKIGEKIIPVINAIAAVKSLVDDMLGKDIERDNIAVNCVRLYMKGIRLDDRTLSLKILANILSDAFEDKIKSVIISKASSMGIKLVNKVKSKVTKSSSAPQHTLPPKPPEQPVAPNEKDTAKPNDEKPGPNNKGLFTEAWKVFHETYKPIEEERGTNHKENERPDGKATSLPKKEHEAPTNISKSTSPKEDKYNEEDREVVNRKTKDTEDDFKGAAKKTNKKKGEDAREKGEDDQEDGSGKSRSNPDKPVKTYPPLEVFTHTTPRKFREKLVEFFKNNPNHPLIAIYNQATNKLHPSTKAGMGSFYWEEHPEAIQAGHVRSKYTGAQDQIVIMTASENQMYNNTVESRRRASIAGGFKVAIIEGLPISVASAKHLIQYKKLDPQALENAQIVDVDDL